MLSAICDLIKWRKEFLGAIRDQKIHVRITQKAEGHPIFNFSANKDFQTWRRMRQMCVAPNMKGGHFAIRQISCNRSTSHLTHGHDLRKTMEAHFLDRNPGERLINLLQLHKQLIYWSILLLYFFTWFVIIGYNCIYVYLSGAFK